MAKIAVVGMGQGGMVAAVKLAEAGYDVSIFEKEAMGHVGYDWRDDIRADVFRAVEMPMPDRNVYCQKANGSSSLPTKNTPCQCLRVRLWKKSPCTAPSFRNTLQSKRKMWGANCTTIAK